MKVSRLISRRLLMLPLSIWVLVTAVFLLTEAMPGDPAQLIAGSFASEEVVSDIRLELGLDRTPLQRYGDYWAGVAHGDLGTSLFTKQAVTSEIERRFPASLEMVLTALVLSTVVGVLVGVVGATFRNRWPDRLVRLYIVTWQAVPVFVVGLGLIYVVWFLLGWAPAPVGRLPIGVSPPERVTGFYTVDSLLAGDWALARTSLAHLILPALSLTMVFSASIGKTARGAMMDALSSDRAEYSLACGLPSWQVTRYALLTARTPIMT